MSNVIAEKLEFAKKTAISAGDILLERFENTQSKLKSKREVVTDADLASEEFIIGAIETEFGESILSEESHEHSKLEDKMWIIDPLDGTNNYANGIPFFSVVIAYYEEGRSLFGVIYEPIREELYWSDGELSYLNNRHIRVSKTNRLIDSIAATGFPYNREKDNENNLDHFTKIALNVRGIRRIGSAALDLAYVACGRMDVYWELNLKPWDLAAGELIVRCAGGKTGIFNGSEWTIEHGRIVASNPELFRKTCNILNDEES